MVQEEKGKGITILTYLIGGGGGGGGLGNIEIEVFLTNYRKNGESDK